MPRILSDKTAQEVIETIQTVKDQGILPQASVFDDSGEEVIFKLVADLSNDKWSADEQERNGTTHAWQDLTGGRELDIDVPLIMASGSVDQIVKAVPSRDELDNPIWIGIALSGGAARPYLKIKTVVDANNYTADIITPTSATVITAGVTVKALQPDAGTLPVNTEIFADIVDDVYYIQPSVFYGS